MNSSDGREAGSGGEMWSVESEISVGVSVLLARESWQRDRSFKVNARSQGNSLYPVNTILRLP